MGGAVGSLAEETAEDRRTKNQSESHSGVIPVDGELRRDSDDDILRAHAVHPKRDPRCLEQVSPDQRTAELETEQKEKLERWGEPNRTHESKRKGGCRLFRKL